MEDQQLKAAANAIWGFIPKWNADLVTKLLGRIRSLGVVPAVYFQAVNRNKKVPARKLSVENIILAKKWDEYIPDMLTILQEEARVNFECDLREYKTALKLNGYNRKAVLADTEIPLSDLFRNQVAEMYGYGEVAKAHELEATKLMLRNPFAIRPYDELRKMTR